MENLSILVTGGAGFIGSHIVEKLLSLGAKHVRVLDNLSTGHKKNIKPFLTKYSNLEFIWGDITNLEDCRKACQGMNIVCHQAALGSVPKSVDFPLASHNINVTGFVNMLCAAKENGIKRFVYASSSAVYGDDESNLKIEDRIGEQLSPYAVNKYVDELYAKIFTRIYGMECIGLRYFNVFGPRQDPNGVYACAIPKFIWELQNDIPSTIFGDGSITRDFTFVENVVYANVLAMITENSDTFGQEFNVGTNNYISINQLFHIIAHCMGKNVNPNFGPSRVGDAQHSNASVEKSERMLGYRVQVPFQEGMQMTVNYFMSN